MPRQAHCTLGRRASSRVLSRRAHRTRFWRSSSCSLPCCWCLSSGRPSAAAGLPSLPTWPASALLDLERPGSSALSRADISVCSVLSSARMSCSACLDLSTESACRDSMNLQHIWPWPHEHRALQNRARQRRSACSAQLTDSFCPMGAPLRAVGDAGPCLAWLSACTSMCRCLTDACMESCTPRRTMAGTLQQHSRE